MGGIEAVNKEITEALAMKYQVYLVNFTGEGTYMTPNEDVHSIFFPKINKWKRILISLAIRGIIPINWQRLFAIQIAHLNALIEQKNMESLIISHPMVAALVPYLNLEKTKAIIWVHSPAEQLEKEIVGYKDIFYRGVKKASQIIVITEHDKIAWIEYTNKVLFIPNMLTLAPEGNRISDLTQKKLLFCGRIDYQHKGIDRLLTIFESVSEIGWELVLVGTGKDLKKLKKALKKIDTIKHIEAVSHRELHQYYSTCSIFLHTSRYEGFGLVIIEAMAFGLPVISFNTTGSEEILTGKHGILIPQNDIEQYVVELKKMMLSIETRRVWQEKSLQRSKDYLPREILGKWQDIL
ncbi:glycosyltransferase family 4 protein [Listeria weihenstephanensis]|uniref:Glycosyltransferase family 4 protein n=1 Tax=Listeria weihenstephanensis TaxID=1006155 RepID=A0A841YZX6_9LIST|nr:glycosyltransferase [Listeria weihenstephanensis]MBC1499071.1 glycosyltransferase family 4 protein [Listeria weihenstephanensis]